MRRLYSTCKCIAGVRLQLEFSPLSRQGEATIRTLLWRAARKVYCLARGEASNDPASNGEYRLLRQVLARCPNEDLCFVDIGANLGNWSAEVCALLAAQNRDGTIIAVEPTSAAFSHLQNRFAGASQVRLEKAAISSECGIADMYVLGALAGTNSLYPIAEATKEPVPTLTVDQLIKDRGLRKIVFVKSDTEGNDFRAILGASQAFFDGIIDVWQFEYNHRWIDARAYLKDVFKFIEDKPYVLGKLSRSGLAIYDSWHPELDRFFEANFVMLRRGSSYVSLGVEQRFGPHNVPVKRAALD
jgi:FkbM family methyltransferase